MEFPMLIRSVRDEERAQYDTVVQHPLQSWGWGEFRKQTGVAVERLGFYEEGKLVNGLQVSFHPLPVIGKTAGYVPKGFMPDEDQLAALKKLGQQHNALFIKLEPNVSRPAAAADTDHETVRKFLTDHNCRPGRPLFTRHTFELDLAADEETLFANLSSKTRYNVRLAQKKGVTIFENTTQEGLDVYLNILKETTARQGFYAHGPEYFQKMWDVLGNTGMMRILNAVYENKVLVSWIVFVFNGVMYYPYGASIREHRDVMASNLMMWEVIRLGKKEGCAKLDMWGSLGPEPNTKDPWYGFHRFKEGYGGTLMEFVGTYDYVLDPMMYQLFQAADSLRWKILRLRKKIGI
jgi:lipid II:glycine glycyltransferase (peptidoglycan interpeptide bridge formation enzyme)